MQRCDECKGVTNANNLLAETQHTRETRHFLTNATGFATLACNIRRLNLCFAFEDVADLLGTASFNLCHLCLSLSLHYDRMCLLNQFEFTQKHTLLCRQNTTSLERFEERCRKNFDLLLVESRKFCVRFDGVVVCLNECLVLCVDTTRIVCVCFVRDRCGGEHEPVDPNRHQ